MPSTSPRNTENPTLSGPFMALSPLPIRTTLSILVPRVSR